MSKTIKGQVNAKWTSTDAYKEGYERIFGKKKQKECPACGGAMDNTGKSYVAGHEHLDKFTCTECRTVFIDEPRLVDVAETEK